jgi:hypothetical protein
MGSAERPGLVPTLLGDGCEDAAKVGPCERKPGGGQSAGALAKWRLAGGAHQRPENTR